MLQAPVESAILTRVGHDDLYDVGISEMHGHRITMEDNHLVVFSESVGFFGVLDGHGGRQCADFIAKYMENEMQNKAMPKDGDDLHALILQADNAFLKSDVVVGGSTGTFALVLRDADDKSKCSLVVANVGDSRVLRGSIDGTMFAGPGTHGALTRDHKPDLPDETERIRNAGGQVGTPVMGGPPRVNNILALSRAFGDSYLKIGGKTEELHCVIAKPEIGSFTCTDSDFLVLACDGVFDVLENTRVIQLVAECISKGESPDRCANKVVQEAFSKGSRDNISCMIVLLRSDSTKQRCRTLLPGPFHVFSQPSNLPCRFRLAYTEFVERAGLTLSESIAMRYRLLLDMRTNGETCEKELAMFGDGPPVDLDEKGQQEWFRQWLMTTNQPSSKTKVPINVKTEKEEHTCADCGLILDACIRDPVDDSWICKKCWEEVYNLPGGPEELKNEPKCMKLEKRQQCLALQVGVADYMTQKEIGPLSAVWQSSVCVGHKTGFGEFIGRGCKPSVQIVFDRKGIDGFKRGPDPFALLYDTGSIEPPPKKISKIN